jgi:hypothetical protein
MKRGFAFFITLLCTSFFLLNQSYGAETAGKKPVDLGPPHNTEDTEGFLGNIFGNINGNINLYYGSKSLNDDMWGNLSSQQGLGINADFGSKSWPVFISVGYIHSGYHDKLPKEYTYTTTFDFGGRGTFPGVPTATTTATAEANTEYKASTNEYRLGAKKIWEPTSNMRPFVGFGLAMIKAKTEISVSAADAAAYSITSPLSDNDKAIGIWMSGGVYWTLFERFNFGAEIAYSQANVKFKETGGKMNAGGTHYGLFVGYHF